MRCNQSICWRIVMPAFCPLAVTASRNIEAKTRILINDQFSFCYFVITMTQQPAKSPKISELFLKFYSPGVHGQKIDECNQLA